MDRITYFSKKFTKCPVCGHEFSKEELLTGRGRLIAGDLTEELRRQYEPSAKYGEVYPLAYPITVCPNCWYAAFAGDFEDIPEMNKDLARDDENSRKESAGLLFPELDFEQPRRLQEGVASYFLALSSYDYFDASAGPKIKQGLCALRAAWLAGDLHRKMPDENFDYVAASFYRKARFFYTLAVEYESSGKEPVGSIPNLGPDLDKNYGYDGVLYLAAYLEYAYGPREEPEVRQASLEQAKRTAARIFGMGKASKKKPSVLLDRSKDLYDTINKSLKEVDA